jgi:glycosyltransferase involved in cell wall biosynthesis
MRPLGEAAFVENRLLSVIVPAYNEAATVGEVLRRVARVACMMEIIVVDDGSRDGTADVIADFRWQISDWMRGLRVLRHGTNCGKGAAIRTGLALARGEYAVIQDADLEYDPADLPRLVEPLLAGEADVVYGSRYFRAGPKLPRDEKGSGAFFASRLDDSTLAEQREPCSIPAKKTPDPVNLSFRWGVRLLNGLVRLLYGVRLTDEATCYKVFRRADLLRMDLQCTGFEFCPEVTAKACRMGLRIREVPISYRPRSRAEGKKIRWRDGIVAARELWRWRKWISDCRLIREEIADCDKSVVRGPSSVVDSHDEAAAVGVCGRTAAGELS